MRRGARAQAILLSAALLLAAGPARGVDATAPAARSAPRKREVAKPVRLTPYDELLKKHSARFNLDWRLMAAQAYQESRFDPSARSWAGARGLFQVMPVTGREMGFDRLEDPSQGILAGIQYLSRLIELFEPALPFRQRVHFALAAYNAGYGHVADARRLAAEVGLDPNRWFQNVERAMLLLERPEYYRRARHGFCRGQQPVTYVSEIQSRYEGYLKPPRPTSGRLSGMK